MLPYSPNLSTLPIRCRTKINPKYTKNNCFCSFFILLNQKQRQLFQEILEFGNSCFVCWKWWVLRLCILIFRLIGPIFSKFSKKLRVLVFFGPPCIKGKANRCVCDMHWICIVDCLGLLCEVQYEIEFNQGINRSLCYVIS